MGAAEPAAPSSPTAEAFEVMPANWSSIIAFLGCETQWRAAVGMAGLVWLGLDYAGVEVALRRLGREACFEDVQLMEAQALRTFGETS